MLIWASHIYFLILRTRCSTKHYPVAVRIKPPEGFRVSGILHYSRHFICAWPYVPEIDFLPVITSAERFLVHVLQNGPRYGKGHDKGWAHEKIGAQVGMDAGLKVAVARKHRSADQVVPDNCLFHLFIQWTRIADASGATIGSEIKTEFFEIRRQSRFFEVFRNDTRSRRKGRLYVFLYSQTLFQPPFWQEVLLRGARPDLRCLCMK